jgi:pyruvate-formate lyase
MKIEMKEWAGFKKGPWCSGIDVANFISLNYTPYAGD